MQVCEEQVGTQSYSRDSSDSQEQGEEDRAEAYEVGADAFISKPFNLAVLHARIRNLLKYKERKAHDFKNQLVFEIKELDYTSIDEDFMQRAIDCVNRHLEDSDFDQPQFVEEMANQQVHPLQETEIPDGTEYFCLYP